jgi:hypothetical protein
MPKSGQPKPGFSKSKKRMGLSINLIAGRKQYDIMLNQRRQKRTRLEANKLVKNACFETAKRDYSERLVCRRRLLESWAAKRKE